MRRISVGNDEDTGIFKLVSVSRPVDPRSLSYISSLMMLITGRYGIFNFITLFLQLYLPLSTPF